MASLSAHLVEAGDHGRLGFHPACPVCREQRLFGSLSSEPVVPRRAQAVLAGGVLAISGAAPGAVVAQEPDRHAEGVVAPDQPEGGDAGDPGFDPGGETELPFETAPVSPTPLAEDDDVAPLDIEPAEDPDARLVPPSEPDTLATEQDLPVPPSTEVAPEETSAAPGQGLGATEPSAPTSDSPSDAPSGHAPDIDRPDAEPKSPGTREPQDPRDTQPPQDRTGQEHRASAGPEVGAPTVPSSGGAPSGLPTAAAPTAAAPESQPVAEAVAPATGGRTEPLGDARFYSVSRGDSLWSIAKRALGREATPAEIARVVARLWSLNEDRIGTGDPDLLMVGTRLRLR
jgi:LysM domain